jgi:hypothetical protein
VPHLIIDGEIGHIDDLSTLRNALRFPDGVYRRGRRAQIQHECGTGRRHGSWRRHRTPRTLLGAGNLLRTQRRRFDRYGNRRKRLIGGRVRHRPDRNPNVQTHGVQVTGLLDSDQHRAIELQTQHGIGTGKRLIPHFRHCSELASGRSRRFTRGLCAVGTPVHADEVDLNVGRRDRRRLAPEPVLANEPDIDFGSVCRSRNPHRFDPGRFDGGGCSHDRAASQCQQDRRAKCC